MSSPASASGADTAGLAPAPTLLQRVRAELSAEFDPSRPMRITRAPGRLDVMGGIAEYTGSMVVQATLDCAAAVALQERSDRAVQIFSFNQLDEHQPFTLRIPLDALAGQSVEKLKQEFSEPGRQWAACLAGGLFVLHEARLVNLSDPERAGLSFALCSTIPIHAGLGSSAAIAVATMMNLVEHFNLRSQLDPIRISTLCQAVQNRLAASPGGAAAIVSSCCGQAHSLLRMTCQPLELHPALPLPAGIGVIGIDSGARQGNRRAQNQTRCAAFMAYAIILHQMKKLGESAGRELIGDPMRGCLANLDPDDYKLTFRRHLPEEMIGREFLDQFGPTIDTIAPVDPAERYPVQHAADHHVLEARRVRRFAEFITQANSSTGGARKQSLDKAGHLMYASHLSYSHDAMLGNDECDLLVQLIRSQRSAGFYGARITAGGGGGTVAVLAGQTESVDIALAKILDTYQDRTGKKPRAFTQTTPGAWHVATMLI